MANQVVNFPDHHEDYTEKKKRTGKRKIEIKPITNKTSKQVTFSKRRTGLFKKASELCSLCGSEVAVITFSGAGKLFSFGHPTADPIIHRYINYSNHINVENNNNNNNDDNNGNDESSFDKLSEEYKKVLSNIEVEKRRTDVASSSSNGSSPRGNNNDFGFWWDKPVDNLGLFELEQLKVSLEGLRDEVSLKVGSINVNRSSTSVFPQRIDLGSTNQDVVARGYEDSAWIDQKESIHSLSLPMNYSMFGHASEN